MFVFADKAAYTDILLQKENNPEFEALCLKKVTDPRLLLDELKTLPLDMEVIVFFDAKGYRGDNATVAVKIATEFQLLQGA
jgi:hypothetical protein